MPAWKKEYDRWFRYLIVSLLVDNLLIQCSLTMLTNPCCIVGCYTNVSKHKDCVLYKFPDRVTESELRKRWIEAVKVANSTISRWEPISSSKLCSEHFLGNCRSLNPSDPNSVPTIFPQTKPVYKLKKEEFIDLYDSDTGSDDYDSEVIEETSDCLFVVGKIKQEVEEKEKADPPKSSFQPKTNGTEIWKPKAAKKRKVPRGCPGKKERNSPMSMESGVSSPKKSKVPSHCIEKKPLQDVGKALFTGKFSSDSSDPDFDENEFAGLYYDEEEDEISEKEFLSVSDKIKVEFKRSSKPRSSNLDSEDDRHASEDEMLLMKKRRKKKRKPARFLSKGSQVALPGVCDGFVFCTSRDDDFNVGVQCNIFYEFSLTNPNVGESSSATNLDVQECIIES